MKLITFCVPCFNSQDYMEKCVDSLLAAGEDAEIIIVDDGSTDDTAAIADRYQTDHPGVVRALHKPNGGHGDAVNAGLREARGQYFKVIDSDDWVDGAACRAVIDTLRGFEKEPLDMLVINYVYERQGVAHKMAMRYGTMLPQHKVFGWSDLMVIRPGQLFHMHAAIYRTGVLRAAKLRLPKHMFYVDNLYVYVPLPHVKRLYYLNVDFYRYFIGRADQSVNQEVLIRRQDMLWDVCRRMWSSYSLVSIEPGKLRYYMLKFLEINLVVSSLVFFLDGSKEARAKARTMWAELRKTDPFAYRRIRWGILGIACNFRTRPMQKFSILCYRTVNKIYGLTS